MAGHPIWEICTTKNSCNSTEFFELYLENRCLSKINEQSHISADNQIVEQEGLCGWSLT